MLRVLGRLHDALRPHTYPLLGVCLAAFLLCAVFLARLVSSEDIATMLPDSGDMATDFALLRHAPFTQRLSITIGHEGNSPIPAAAALVRALRREPVFRDVLTGPPSAFSPELLREMAEIAPALLTETDLRELDRRLSAKAIHSALEHGAGTLLAPEGLALKTVIARDPLDIRNLLFPKLATAARLTGARLHDGHFVSRDGKHALIIADTDIPMTDALGAGRVMDAYHTALRALPRGATATLVGGHPHTLANAETIKQDLKRLLPASLVLLTLLFVLFLRTAQSLTVFLLPVGVVCAAGALTAFVFDGISGIVLGFGAVLLGISVDYALHVFIALRQPGDAAPSDRLRAVAKPVILGALTSCAAFGALLVSAVPGIRQLAVFSVLGLTVSLLLSLIILPLCVTPANTGLPAALRPTPTPHNHPAWLLPVWALILGLGSWSGTNLRLDGDLRALSHTSAEIRANEAATRQIWGGRRDLALVFARGTTPEKAREANDAVWALLQDAGLDREAISLSPLLPSLRTQTENLARWTAFWKQRAPRVLADLDASARVLGFSPTAFAPFAKALARKPRPVSETALSGLGGDELLRLLTIRDQGTYLIMTLLPDTPRARALFSPDTEQHVGARLVAGSRFREMLGAAMGRDVLRFCALALTVVTLITALLFRDIRRSLRALLPVGAGVAAFMAVMGATAQPLTLFHVIALPLIMGLSADYGIFMVHRERAPTPLNTERAVLLSGLTTLAGFGVLILARHPALHALGGTVLIGVAVAMGTALWVVPHLGDPS